MCLGLPRQGLGIPYLFVFCNFVLLMMMAKITILLVIIKASLGIIDVGKTLNPSAWNRFTACTD